MKIAASGKACGKRAYIFECVLYMCIRRCGRKQEIICLRVLDQSFEKYSTCSALAAPCVAQHLAIPD